MVQRNNEARGTYQLLPAFGSGIWEGGGHAPGPLSPCATSLCWDPLCRPARCILRPLAAHKLCLGGELLEVQLSALDWGVWPLVLHLGGAGGERGQCLRRARLALPEVGGRQDPGQAVAAARCPDEGLAFQETPAQLGFGGSADRDGRQHVHLRLERGEMETHGFPIRNELHRFHGA